MFNLFISLWCVKKKLIGIYLVVWYNTDGGKCLVMGFVFIYNKVFN